MERIVNGYFRLLQFLVVLCLATMCVLVFGNVVLRYAFNTGITVSEEFSRWCFVWLTFLGAIIAMKKHGHLGMDSLVVRLPVIGKKICLVASLLLMLYATWLFLRGSWTQTVINLEVSAPATGLPVGLVYGVGVVFGLSVIPILLFDLYRVFFGKLNEDELVMITESEELAEFKALEHELAKKGGGALPQSGSRK